MKVSTNLMLLLTFVLANTLKLIMRAQITTKGLRRRHTCAAFYYGSAHILIQEPGINFGEGMDVDGCMHGIYAVTCAQVN